MLTTVCKMVDINALSQIKERIRIHRNLGNSIDETTDFLTLNKEFSDVTRTSIKCIKDVAGYARKINEDLVKFRELTKEFTIQIGEKMKRLGESGIIIGKDIGLFLFRCLLIVLPFLALFK